MFSGTRRNTFYSAAIAAGLLVITLAIYWQVGAHSFILFDDEDYILLNSRLRLGFTAENIRWYLTSSHASNWHPLTWFSHMLDVKLFGYNPTGHHYVSVALHGTNAILLFLFLQRFTGSLWRSAVVAALFAIHPLNVESVAWVSERKNVLSTLFWILTIFFYANYTQRKSRSFYILAVSAFILGLMSKQMLVSIPFVLLLLDYWPLRRFPEHTGRKLSAFLCSPELRSLLLEKAPFFILAVAASVIAVVSQQKAISSLLNSTVTERLVNASVSYIQYLRMIFWPGGLSVFYPFPESKQTGMFLVSVFLLLVISGSAFKLRKRCPVLFVGWFWFLITLVPVIGIVRIGLQAMADRYAYIPSIGIFMIVVWSFSDLLRDIPFEKFILGGITVICIVLLSVTTWRQASYWKDSMSLFTHAAVVTEGNYIALCGIGRALEREGKLDEALQKFDEALEVAPWYEYAKTHQGIILMNRGRLDAAVFKYSEAILQNPETVPGHINLGIVMALQGRLDEAAANFRIAIDFDPRSAAAHYNLALTLYKQGRIDEAITQYVKTLDTDPTDHDCHNNLGIALVSQGRYDEAIPHFKEALRLKPNQSNVKSNLELAIQKQWNNKRP